MSGRQKSIQKVTIQRFGNPENSEVEDLVTIERALAIFLVYADNPSPQQLSITMRTPGDDEALAIGFAFNEGILHSMADIKEVTFSSEDEITLHLHLSEPADQIKTERNFISNASCGVCGKSSIEDAMKVNFSPIPQDDISVTEKIIYGLSEKLLQAQKDFDQTGGIHAVGLYDLEGELLALSEDVGRHNALDKMIGKQVIKNNIPLNRNILLLSGRVGYELVQKSLMARIPILVAIGAPSSLCFDLAANNNLTMIGFLKKTGFNLYSGSQRITTS